MNLNELEALAKAVASRPIMDNIEYYEGLVKYLTAANPETILRLIELVREMGEALESCAVAFSDDEELHDVLAKFKDMTK